jgi:hypothetical protein
LLFRSIADFMAFALRQVREGDTDDEIALRSLSFDRKKDLPPSLMREIREHRWPVAGNRAYPTLICLDEEMAPIQATKHDFRILTVCTQAFLSFFERHADVFDTDELEPTAEVFTTGDEITVVFHVWPRVRSSATRSVGRFSSSLIRIQIAGKPGTAGTPGTADLLLPKLLRTQ